MSAFKFPDELLSQHIVIVGKTGSGKTYTGKGMVERLLARQRRVCILDPTGVWWGLRSTASGKGGGFPVVVFGGQHADVPIAEGSGAALAKIVAEKNLPSIIDLSEMLIGGRHRFMTDFAEALYRFNRQPLHLVIDEADEFAPQNPMPETKRMLHHVDRIVRRGRVRGLRAMLITQRPAVLHKNVMTQANTLIAMRLTSPQDRNAIKAWIEGQADATQGKAVLDSLPRLQTGEGWVWAPELELLERVTFPKIDTFDSSRTPENDETVLEPTKLAAVDLTEIKASFAAVEQEAKTLVELKAEVAKLRKELAIAQKPRAGEARAIDDAEIARRIDVAVAQAVKHERAASSRELEKVTVPLAKIRDLAMAALGGGFSAMTREAVALPPAPRSTAMQRQVAAAAAPLSVPGPVSSGASAPQQRILNALAWFSAIGLEAPRRSPLGAVAGSSPKSSGFEKNLSTLRTAGLIDYPDQGRVALTDAGRSAAHKPAHAPTESALHEAIYRMVSGPQAVLLRVLVGLRGKAIARDQLAREANVSALSSGFEKNISTLRGFELIDYPQKGSVVATDILFPERA